jgi:hypothetical protein
MRNDLDLYNATVVGENPESIFLAEDDHLHAVEEHIAEQKKEKCQPELVLPLMRKALIALEKFAKEKVPTQFKDVDIKAISLKEDEKDQLIEKIKNIYSLLPHHVRNELSSLIHHKQN